MWSYVEADFRRDYGIRLVTELPLMSWREFKILLDGLSPWGSLATNYERELKKQREREEQNSDKPSSAETGFWNMIASYHPTVG